MYEDAHPSSMVVVVSQYSSKVYIRGAKQKMLPKTHLDSVIILVGHHPLKVYISSCRRVMLLRIENMAMWIAV